MVAAAAGWHSLWPTESNQMNQTIQPLVSTAFLGLQKWKKYQELRPTFSIEQGKKMIWSNDWSP